MSVGIIFDIKEFAVFDGPGIRTTVFLKGCPLRCAWCHNPEGQRPERELMVSVSGCTRCGRCERVCPSPGNCRACGACVPACPQGIRRIAGIPWEAAALAKKLLRNADYLAENGGGYTVSGGEPAAQGEFLLELLTLLRGNHRAVETSGFCSQEFFQAMTGETELILLDLKHRDPGAHRRWTGADNGPILANLEYLKQAGNPFIIRIPVIPGVNDREASLKAAAELLAGSRGLLRVELLPYHRTAGAKYAMLGQSYEPAFDPMADPRLDTRPFLEKNIPCVII